MESIEVNGINWLGYELFFFSYDQGWCARIARQSTGNLQDEQDSTGGNLQTAFVLQKLNGSPLGGLGGRDRYRQLLTNNKV